MNIHLDYNIKRNLNDIIIKSKSNLKYKIKCEKNITQFFQFSNLPKYFFLIFLKNQEVNICIFELLVYSVIFNVF